MSGLEPVHCAGCGAPVRLAAASPTTCAHCGAAVLLPATHVALFARIQHGEEELRAADALWRESPKPMPASAPSWIAFGIVVAILGSVSAWAVMITRFSIAPATGFVIFGLAPSLAAMHVGLEVLAYWSPLRRLEASLSAVIAPASAALACRRCGAPIDVRDDMIVSRCAYCATDNLVREPRPAAHARARRIAAEGAAQLTEAISNLRALVVQRAIVRYVSLSCIVGLLAVFGLVAALH